MSDAARNVANCDHDAMDEGTAALTAGAFALIGAFASAGAAMWGARTGAAKGLEAAHAQVEGQEKAEHRHWAREQRMLTLMEVLDQLAALQSTLNAAKVKLTLGEVPPDSLHEQYRTAQGALLRILPRLSVWGPELGPEINTKLINQADQVYKSWWAWQSAVTDGLLADAYSETFQRCDRELTTLHVEFAKMAAQALREPEKAP
ncbi:hypothetical protein ABZX90_27830 [Streptomyces sp. NPDC002935]|uniref:hypothetical protein n=1 Tax=Streptomyces sp. NPDC002935 TaxID=3154545 RepID=UPI0033A46AA9